ncbi:MAG: hypothetical protein AAF573_12695 [Bacteroidota bacterium]
MKTIQTFIFLLSFTFPILCFSQKSFYSEALVVDTQLDTIRGFILKENEKNLSKAVQFKQALSDAEAQIFKPRDIQEFRFLDDKRIFRSIESKSTKAEENLKNPRFGKLLVDGYCQLYKIKLSAGEFNAILLREQHIYVVKKKDEWYRLEQIEEKIRGEKSNYRLLKKYVGVLQYITSDCKKNIINPDKLDFKDSKIANVIFKYNQCQSPDAANIILKSKLKTELKHYAQAKTVIPIRREFLRLRDDITDSDAYGFGYMFSVYNPELSRNFSANFGLDFVRTREEKDTETETKNSLDLYFTGNYFFSKTKLRPFVNLGGRIIDPGIMYGGGFHFDRWRVYCNFYVERVMIQRRPNYLEVGIGYAFLKN